MVMMLRRALALVSIASLASFSGVCHAQTLPTAPAVVHGTVTHAVSGATMTITQSTPQAIVNYAGFSIGAGNRVDISQPSAQSALLGRVTGGDPSQILGALTSNGHVCLVNPNGIFFGPDSVVNVNSLIASTLDVSDADFLSGQLRFPGGGTGEIQALGTITANAVALLARNVMLGGSMTVESLAVGAGKSASISLPLANDNGSVTVDFGDAYVPGATIVVHEDFCLAAGEGILDATGEIVVSADGSGSGSGGGGVTVTAGGGITVITTPPLVTAGQVGSAGRASVHASLQRADGAGVASRLLPGTPRELRTGVATEGTSAPRIQVDLEP